MLQLEYQLQEDWNTEVCNIHVLSKGKLIHKAMQKVTKPWKQISTLNGDYYLVS
jgi:hypothetical protein